MVCKSVGRISGGQGPLPWEVMANMSPDGQWGGSKGCGEEAQVHLFSVSYIKLSIFKTKFFILVSKNVIPSNYNPFLPACKATEQHSYPGYSPFAHFLSVQVRSPYF